MDSEELIRNRTIRLPDWLWARLQRQASEQKPPIQPSVHARNILAAFVDQNVPQKTRKRASR